LYIRASIEEITKRMGLTIERTRELLESAKRKCMRPACSAYALCRQDVYTGWNALCVSRIWKPPRHWTSIQPGASRCAPWIAFLPSLAAGAGLRHVIAYSEAPSDRRAERNDERRPERRAFLACSTTTPSPLSLPGCLRGTADISYFNFAQRIIDKMLDRMFDPSSGVSSIWPARRRRTKANGVLGTRRKPFQDSPTPAGNSVAVIALLRLYAYTNQKRYREQAEQTLELLAGLAGKFGIFAARTHRGGAFLAAAYPDRHPWDDDLALQLHAEGRVSSSSTNRFSGCRRMRRSRRISRRRWPKRFLSWPGH